MPPSTPPAKNDPYGFILQEKPKPKRSFIPNWSGPIKVAVGLVAILVLVIIYAALTGGKPSNYQQIEDIMARQQEIIRANGLVGGRSKDPNTTALAATINASVLSSQSQLKSYLAKNRVKYKPQVLGARANKDTDSTFATAAQNNNFDGTYFAYLQTNLKSYGDALKTTWSSVGPNAKKILDQAYQSVAILSTAPQLK